MALGAKEVCLTAHHTGGFALFQTDHTNYSIRQSPYKAGKGDIVKEFTDSCRAYNITPCTAPPTYDSASPLAEQPRRLQGPFFGGMCPAPHCYTCALSLMCIKIP